MTGPGTEGTLAKESTFLNYWFPMAAHAKCVYPHMNPTAVCIMQVSPFSVCLCGMKWGHLQKGAWSLIWLPRDYGIAFLIRFRVFPSLFIFKRGSKAHLFQSAFRHWVLIISCCWYEFYTALLRVCVLYLFIFFVLWFYCCHLYCKLTQALERQI